MTQSLHDVHKGEKNIIPPCFLIDWLMPVKDFQGLVPDLIFMFWPESFVLHVFRNT